MAVWQVVEVHLHAEVVALLGLDDVGSVLALEDRVGAVLEEFFVAFYVDGDENFGFGFGGRDVEGDVVEVGGDLIDGGGGGTGFVSSCPTGRSPALETYSGAKRSRSRLSMSTFW